jgi:thiamine kinase-like enzyme
VAVRQALAELVGAYRRCQEVLLHNDLHTGNLLATQTSLACIDW